MPTLDRHDTVYVLDLGDGENRFHPDWLTEVNALLDQVAQGDDPRALVTTATGRYWSNGLDLEWLFANPEQYTAYGWRVHALHRPPRPLDERGRRPVSLRRDRARRRQRP